MRMIHVLRKPLSEGTVASNVLKHGTGGLNIDASRISTDDNLNGGAYAENHTERWDGAENWRYKRGEPGNAGEYRQPSGRWPANLILQHLDGCRCDGTKRVKAISGGASSGDNAFGQDSGWNAHQNRPTNITRQGDKDGKETVANWTCVEGCPVAALDAQVPDPGGVSRFFKQATDLPDLVAYLDTLIRPVENPIIITAMEDLPPASVHGAILDTANLDDAVFEVMKPGGHLLMIGSPQDYGLVCRMEDLGFEVRDSICVLDSPQDKAHYVPKAGKTEKESGCWDLEPQQQDASRSADKVGGNNPRNRGAKKRLNPHPTVKPVAVMEALLEDVPKDRGPVVDPFMGSGTTMLACLKTRHSGIGIERDPEYIKVADARVRHWDYAHNGWVQTKVESDVVKEDPEKAEAQSLLDFFGIGSPQ